MSEPTRVLYVSSEIFPYLPETRISKVGRYLPQGAQERGCEIRSFMPRYGVINERRNQLHEVIRLSGMNIIINDLDRPLIIKVSSIPAARMQVYFIDNEDYFSRKHIYGDSKKPFFKDNDERALFSHFLPVYLKKAYSDDPIFTDSKIILSMYNDGLEQSFNEQTISKVLIPGVKAKDLASLNPANGINLAKLAIEYSDGIIAGEEDLSQDLNSVMESSGKPVLPYADNTGEEDGYMDEYIQFYNKILEK
jgi:starch synthase